MRHMKPLIVLAVALVVVGGSPARATPPRGPIAIEHSDIPAGLKVGDEATTTIRFRALSDLDRVEVSIYPFRGVRVLSAPTTALFTDLHSGDIQELPVRVRLTDASIASLAVTYRAISGGRRRTGAVTIEFL